MKAYFKALLETLQGIQAALDRLVPALIKALAVSAAHGDLEDRLASLERELQTWEARVEGDMMRAESRFRAARSAEERTRHAQRADEDDEEGDDGLEAFRDILQAGNVERGPEEGVLDMPSGVDGRASTKQRLRAQKFGV